MILKYITIDLLDSHNLFWEFNGHSERDPNFSNQDSTQLNITIWRPPMKSGLTPKTIKAIE